MQKITHFEAAHAALRQFYGDHADGPYTLDRMRQLMQYLGNPQEAVRVVHVAGTSGKTSTAYFVAALLMQAGAKVGLTVSPHVDEVNERVQIDGVPLPEVEFCHELSEFLQLIEASGILPSYFECMAAFAYWEFARQKVGYAVVEVGLGGLLDGTNVVSRADKVCVITDIGLDHTELLGDTVDKIAAQKAGIVQPGNDVFMHQQAPEIMDVVDAVCKNVGADLHVTRPAGFPAPTQLPAFQQRNFSLAQEVVDWVLHQTGARLLTAQQIAVASQVYIPARMEIMQYAGKTIVVDGAHNAQKLEALCASIADKYPNVPIAAVVGFVDGDVFRLHQALDVLIQHCTYLIITEFYTEKDYPKHSVPATIVEAYCHQSGFDTTQIVPDPASALHVLLKRPEELCLVTGSFYLLNHIRPELLEHA